MKFKAWIFLPFLLHFFCPAIKRISFSVSTKLIWGFGKAINPIWWHFRQIIHFYSDPNPGICFNLTTCHIPQTSKHVTHHKPQNMSHTTNTSFTMFTVYNERLLAPQGALYFTLLSVVWSNRMQSNFIHFKIKQNSIYSQLSYLGNIYAQYELIVTNDNCEWTNVKSSDTSVWKLCCICCTWKASPLCEF